MASEKNLRMLILVLYASALSHMLWTGEIYRFVGGWLVPWLWACCVVLWILVCGMVVSMFSRSRSDESTDALVPVGAASPASKATWDMAQGVLYALFAMPPVIYIAGAITGDLRWF
ncbi:MAG: DUF1980 domain-containing protein [Firmicutes bacterium]|nr:DUF1980 domain-containing protein [Bacillota bacterium]